MAKVEDNELQKASLFGKNWVFSVFAENRGSSFFCLILRPQNSGLERPPPKTILERDFRFFKIFFKISEKLHNILDVVKMGRRKRPKIPSLSHFSTSTFSGQNSVFLKLELKIPKFRNFRNFGQFDRQNSLLFLY